MDARETFKAALGAVQRVQADMESAPSARVAHPSSVKPPGENRTQVAPPIPLPLKVATLPTPPETDSVDGDRIKVLVSWAHKGENWTPAQTDEWELQVVEFTRALCDAGIEADLDLFHVHDQMADWTRFGQNAVAEADFVLVAMTKAWGERWSGKNAPHVGAGVAVEADALKGLFNRDQEAAQKKLKIVLLGDQSADDIPHDMGRFQRFTVDTQDPKTLEDLLRTLTAQPYYIRPPLGRVPVLAPAARTNIPSSLNLGTAKGALGFGTTAPQAASNDVVPTDSMFIRSEYDFLSAELKLGTGDAKNLLRRMAILREKMSQVGSASGGNIEISETNAG